MSDTDNKVTCKTHGEGNASFLCCHLINGKGLGFNLGYDPDYPDELCPDAWCDRCEEVLDTEGEWNENSEAFADIKVLCEHCYEDIRERNWVQNDDIYHELVTDSFSFIEPKHNDFLDNFNVGNHERWDWHQETGKIIFSNKGVQEVEASIHFAGSFSTKSNTWMWAWANTSLEEKVKASSRVVRELGEELGLKQLVSGRWSATEVDGWEMTSVLAKALNAIGMYRTSTDNGFIYMVVTDAKWLES
ncbi:hypothetical protein P4S60_01640 [Pseudoalteromonas sp. Hal040]|uniref:DUF6882 domain-containing protein n=1 Tax=unclassified Pseudoalteromonas TaxID=194690 RepID=UPI00301C2276